MLVLSRKKEEEVVIGDGIVVKVLGITGDRVKIGLTAPQTTSIVRGELIHGSKKKKDKKQWAGTTESLTNPPTSPTSEQKTETLTKTGNSISTIAETR
jgi:carbon storage regulator